MHSSGTLADLPELTVEQVEHWVTAALAEAKALRQHDDQLYPEISDPAALRAAHQLHASWRAWVDDAESLYERVRLLRQRGQHLAGADDLEHEILRARAMLQLTPEQM